MKLDVTSHYLIIVLLVRHRVVRIQNDCIYRVFLFSFLYWLFNSLFWN